jgi:hypothetical protein
MPIDDYSSDAPDAAPTNASAPAPGKFIKLSVPDYANTGNPNSLGSYLRLGAVEDLTKAGKASGSVGLITDMAGNPLVADPYAPFNPSYDPYAPWGPTNTPADPSVVPPAPATTPGSSLPPVPPQSAANPTAAGPDPTGEDLASLVQGFVDDTRNRGVWTGNPGGQRQDPGTTAQGPLYGYPWVTPVTDAKAPGQLDGTDTSTTTTPNYTTSSTPVFFPNDYRTLESSQIHTKGGWRDHTDGNRVTTTRGDKVEVIRGNYKLIVLGRQDQTKPKYAGFDLSGGQSDTAGGDLTANASTDFNQGSTAYSNLFEWRQLTTPENAKKVAAQQPVDTAQAEADVAAAKANAASLQATADALTAASNTAAAAAATATAAAAATEDPNKIAAANAASAAAAAAAQQAATAQAQAQEDQLAANTAAAAAKNAQSAYASAVSASAAASKTSQTAAQLAQQQPNNPQAVAAAAAAATAATKAQAAVAPAAAANTAAQEQVAPTAAAATASEAAAQTAMANAATAAAAAQAAQQNATSSANPVTQQEAIQAQGIAANAAAAAAAAQTQAALAAQQVLAAEGRLQVIQAGLDATPLEKLHLWEDDGANPDFRSISTAKKGSGPKVQVKYQKGEADPSLIQIPDGVTFATPISMGVSVGETWSYQNYNYTGIGYYPLTHPQPDNPIPYPAPKTQTWSLDGKTPIEAPARNPPPPDFPTEPEWQIYPVSKVVNKSYIWRQSSETFIEQSVTITAGPRLSPVIADPSAPARTYPPDAFGARLYDRDVLKAVLEPGAGPGAYNKVANTWAETHVVDQKTWLRAVDTLSDTEVVYQHTVLEAGTTLAENTVGSQTTISVIGTSMAETTVGVQTTILEAGTSTTDNTYGTQSTVTRVGSQSTELYAGSTRSLSEVGTKTDESFYGTQSTLSVVGTSESIQEIGTKTTVTITDLDLTLSLVALHVGLTVGNKIDVTIGNSITARFGSELSLTTSKKVEGTNLTLFY